MKAKYGWLAVVAVAAGWGSARAQAPGGFEAVHGVSASGYQAFVDRVKATKRVAFVHVTPNGNALAFSAVAVADGKGWSARHGMTAAEYQVEFDKQTRAGRRPAAVCGYVDGGQTRFAATWVNDVGGWSAKHNITSAEYQTAFTAASRQGQRPAFVTGYRTRDGHRFAAAFVAAGGAAVEARHDIAAADYQRLFDTLPGRGFRPDYVCAYNTAGGVRYSAVFVKDYGDWAAKHGLSAAAYQTEFDKQSRLGFRPACISGYADGGLKFAALWTKSASTPSTLPVTGAAVAQLKSLDDAMLKILRDRGWTAGVLAVSRGGKTVLAHGYGFRDAARKQQVQPETPFRIASITKPMTAAVIRQLIAEGKLKGSDKALTILGLAPTSGGDTRLRDITVDNLLDHRGGWNRDTSKYDPMFDVLNISKSLKRTPPASSKDVIDFMMGMPLQFAPGSDRSYSNFGYCMLGRIVEKKSGRTYTAELQRRMAAVGMPTLQQARSLSANRNPAEPIYIDSATAVNVFNQNGPRVPFPDGGFHIEAMDAHGGLICSAPDYCKFMRRFWISGQPRTGTGQNWNHTGSLPGMFGTAKQRSDGVDFIAMFNQRRGGSADDEITAILDKAIAAIKTWP